MSLLRKLKKHLARNSFLTSSIEKNQTISKKDKNATIDNIVAEVDFIKNVDESSSRDVLLQRINSSFKTLFFFESYFQFKMNEKETKQSFNKLFEIIVNRMLDSQLTFEKSNVDHASMISNLDTRDLMKKSFTFDDETIESSDRKKTVQEKTRLLNKTIEKTISHQFKMNEKKT